MARKKKRSTPAKGEKKVALSREAEDELVSAPSLCGWLPTLSASNDVTTIYHARRMPLKRSSPRLEKMAQKGAHLEDMTMERASI